MAEPTRPSPSSPWPGAGLSDDQVTELAWCALAAKTVDGLEMTSRTPTTSDVVRRSLRVGSLDLSRAVERHRPPDLPPDEALAQVRTWSANGGELAWLGLDGPRPHRRRRPLRPVEIARLVRLARPAPQGDLAAAWRMLVAHGLHPVRAVEGLDDLRLGRQLLPNGQLPHARRHTRAEDRQCLVIGGRVVRVDELGEVLASLREGRKIGAIKALRSVVPIGLREAKELVEQLEVRGLAGLEPAPGMAWREGRADSLARRAFDRAMDAVIIERPLHWSVLAMARIVEDPTVPTMAVGLDPSGGVYLFFNPAFVLRITHEERMGVLVHEIDHVLFGHLEPRPAAAEHHRRAWTLATECIANEYVPFPLPGRPITIELLGLPAGRSTRELLELLLAQRDLPEAKPPDLLLGVAVRAEAKSHTDTVDGPPGTARQILAVAAATVGEEIDTVTLDRLQRTPGLLSRSTVALLEPEGVSQLPWDQLLRVRSKGLHRRRSTRSYPSRRHPELVGIVPGHRALREKPRVMVAIDTSASMTEAELRRVLAELDAMLAQGTRVTLVQCDTQIRSEQVLERGLPRLELQGRGGTDLRPPFAPAVIERLRPDLLVYFTDGYGPAPDRAPTGVQVLWVLCGRQPALPASWGEAATMVPRAGREPVGRPT